MEKGGQGRSLQGWGLGSSRDWLGGAPVPAILDRDRQTQQGGSFLSTSWGASSHFRMRNLPRVQINEFSGSSWNNKVLGNFIFLGKKRLAWSY